METEAEICTLYAGELAAIAALDHSYYLKPGPTRADRSNYHARQDRLEEMRSRFYVLLYARIVHDSSVFIEALPEEGVGLDSPTSPEGGLFHEGKSSFSN